MYDNFLSRTLFVRLLPLRLLQRPFHCKPRPVPPSLPQALLMAPIFVLIEIVFLVGGKKKLHKVRMEGGREEGRK